MHTIYELVTLEVQNEHDLEHDLPQRKLFSTPKIYDANGDLSKRWYVYFSYLNPETGKLERMKNIYGKTNRYKIGKSVNIKLENYPDTEFGVLNGTVKNISLIPDKDGLYLIDVDS